MMHQEGAIQAAERTPCRPTWRRWAVLGVACGLIVLSTLQLAYRYTLPTDGWAVLSSDDLDRPDWIYLSNLVGASSGLQRDDRLVAIADLSVAGQTGTRLLALPGWKVGQVINLQVIRHDQSIALAIPVVQWTPAALWRMLFESPEILVGLLGGLILTGLALYTFWQRPDAPAASPLLLLGATFLAIQISHVLPDGLSVQFDSLAFYADGVFGYLLKDTQQDELLRAIRTIAQGGAIFSPGIAQRVLRYLSAPPPVVVGAVFDELAPREREILEGIAQGQTNSEIAARLNLSTKTISNYISNILLKVHATDRAKLMLMALDAGMGQHKPGL